MKLALKNRVHTMADHGDEEGKFNNRMDKYFKEARFFKNCHAKRWSLG
jgi:hypothetical protein